MYSVEACTARRQPSNGDAPNSRSGYGIWCRIVVTAKGTNK